MRTQAVGLLIPTTGLCLHELLAKLANSNDPEWTPCYSKLPTHRTRGVVCASITPVGQGVRPYTSPSNLSKSVFGVF